MDELPPQRLTLIKAMNKVKILCFLFVFFTGCSMSHSRFSDSEIIKLAKEYYWHDPQSQIQGRFEAFEDMNWRMPADLKEVENEIKWISRHNGMRDWNRLRIAGKEQLKSYKQLLRDRDSHFLSFQDSCFFYNDRWKIGCILYKSHCIMLNIDPWNYASRVDFIDWKGHNMGKWKESDSFYSEMDALSREYPNRLKCAREFDKLDNYYTAFSPVFLDGKPRHNETVFRQIIAFSRDEPMYYVCEKRLPDSLWAENKYGEKVPLPDDLETTCKDFILRLEAMAQSYLDKNPDCQMILCPVPYVY